MVHVTVTCLLSHASRFLTPSYAPDGHGRTLTSLSESRLRKFIYTTANRGRSPVSVLPVRRPECGSCVGRPMGRGLAFVFVRVTAQPEILRHDVGKQNSKCAVVAQSSTAIDH